MLSMFKNRWFYICLVLAATNAAVAALWLGGLKRRSPTTVLRVAPQELSTPAEAILFSFSRPMVPAEDTLLVRPVPELKVTPSIPLLGLWKTPSTLEVRAEGRFAMATEYDLKLSPGLLDREGHPVSGNLAFKVRTPRLAATDARQIALSRDWTARLSVNFNDDVPLAELDRKIRFTDDSGASVPMVRETSADAARTVTYTSDPKRRRWIDVRIEEGLRGVSGPLGLPSQRTIRISIESGLEVVNVSSHMNDPGDGWIDLHLSLEVDPRVAKDYVRLEPSVLWEAEGIHGGLRLRGNFQSEILYRIALKAGLPARDGRFLADDVVRSLRFPALQPKIDFVGEGRYLNRQGSLCLTVRSVNVSSLLVSIERIFPNNIVHFIHNDHRDSSGDSEGYLGSQVLESRKINLHSPRNQAAFSRLDLGELLPKDLMGPLEVKVRSGDDRWESASKTVTITDLGLHVKVSRDGFLAWVVRLAGLSPVAGAEVTVFSRANQEIARGTTDSEGLVRLEEAGGADSGEPFVVTARAENDFTYVPIQEARVSVAGLDVSGRPYAGGALEAFAYAERGVIRPGEAIHLRAILRDGGGGLPEEGMPLTWEISRPDHRVAAAVPVTLSALGTCEAMWTSRTELPTGRYSAALKVPGAGSDVLGGCDFRVEEFIPDTLRVTLKAEERRFAGGSPLEVKVTAEHLFGGSAEGLEAKARCELRPLPFTHPAWPGVSFTSSTGEFTGSTLKPMSAGLDKNGSATFKFEIPEDLKARSALQAAVTVNVFEVSGRSCTARIVREVDPQPWYLGARQEKGNAQVGREWRIETIALRPDGSMEDVPKMAARVLKLTWNHALKKDGDSGVYRWVSEKIEKEVASREILCAGGRGTLAFTPAVGGEYQARFTAPREGGKIPAGTSIDFYAEGGEKEDGSLEVPSRIALTPDRQYYRAGEVARIRVQSPITGSALLATETDRIHDARTFALTEPQTVLEVPVSADLLPHGYVTLTVVRSSNVPGARGVPVRAYGAAAILRDPADRESKVELVLPEEVRPGKDLPIQLQVLGPDCAPEEAEVAVALVDSGILSLTGFGTPDPLGFFTARRELGTSASDIFSMIVPEPADLIAKAPSAPGGDGDGGASGLLNPIESKRVKSVSLWLGGLRTDGEGRISTTIQAPDFDGELFAMAVVGGRNSVGSAGRALKVRRPVILEPGLPRFLAPGDRFLAPVSLHNTTDSEVQALVALSTSGNLKVVPPETGEGSAAVPPRDSAVLWFTLEAAQAGKAEVAFTLKALGEEVRKVTEIPIRPALPPAAESGCLSLDPGTSGKLEASKDRFLEGTLTSEIVLSSSILPTMEGSLQYVLHYPYGCVEQTSSSLIPWITLRDYLKALDSELYTDSEIQERVLAGVDRLFSMQTSDGGLGWWPGAHTSYNYGSLHAASVLLEAKAAGYALPGAEFQSLLDYIDRLLVNPREDRDHDGREVTALSIRANALWILARAGRPRPGWIETLYERRNELTEEGRAHLAVAAALAKQKLPGPVLVLDELSVMKKTPDPKAEIARDLGGILYSRPRELCVVLSALIDLGEPRERILPVLMALTGFRKDGRFRSTQEDGLFLFTMGKAAKLFSPPSGPVRATLEVPGEPPRSLEVKDRLVLRLPGGAASPKISVQEGGTLFAFWQARGTPQGGAAEEDRGIQVRRAFYGTDGKLKEGGSFLQGEPVVVEIRLKGASGLQNLVVVDPLPAGFEIENPNLVTSDGKTRAEPEFGVTHSDIRDDRLILFANPRKAECTYSYVARAVTAGRFALPPVSAECMYDSDIRSLHGSGVVEVVK